MSGLAGSSFRKNSRYAEDHMVDVDQNGFYDKIVGMEELCYCVGVASIFEDQIYAAHVSPGEIGRSPEDIMSDFREGESNYVVKGFRSLEYDPNTFNTIIAELDSDPEIFEASRFTLDNEGRLYEDLERLEEIL